LDCRRKKKILKVAKTVKYFINLIKRLVVKPEATKEERCIMVVNIEQEYDDYICNRWQKLSDVTKNILSPHQKSQYTQMISQWSIQFLHDKLENLDTKQK